MKVIFHQEQAAVATCLQSLGMADFTLVLCCCLLLVYQVKEKFITLFPPYLFPSLLNNEEVGIWKDRIHLMHPIELTLAAIRVASYTICLKVQCTTV